MSSASWVHKGHSPSLPSKFLNFSLIWGASREKVPNGLNRCYSKRRMGAAMRGTFLRNAAHMHDMGLNTSYHFIQNLNITILLCEWKFPDKIQFSISKSWYKLMYIFLYVCSTPLERDEWLKALNDAILENTKRRKSFDVRTLQQSISVNVNVCNTLPPFQYSIQTDAQSELLSRIYKLLFPLAFQFSFFETHYMTDFAGLLFFPELKQIFSLSDMTLHPVSLTGYLPFYILLCNYPPSPTAMSIFYFSFKQLSWCHVKNKMWSLILLNHISDWYRQGFQAWT